MQHMLVKYVGLKHSQWKRKNSFI